MKKIITVFLMVLSLNFSTVIAQTKTDRPNPFQKTDTVSLAYQEPDKYKTRLLPSLIVPTSMIAIGLTCIKNHGIYSSYQAREDIQRALGGRGSHIDDFLIFSPYVEFAALTALKIKCKNDFLNTSLLILKSELIMAAIVFPMKQLTNQERPYSYARGLEGVPLSEREKNPNAFQSLPSGHTAQAFAAASVVHKEFRHRSRWYGIGAYTLASTVAFYRMVNDKHWLSDVIVGAGIGIMSTHIAYATHQHRWGRKEVCFVPTYDGRSKGILMVCKF